MTHQTEIIKTTPNTEIHLSIGRAKDSKIYVNVRHYYQDELIDAGDITISQAEWNLINTNLNRKQPKLYFCPECGDIVTEEEIEDQRENGGYGMCTCRYGNGRRTLVEYQPFKLELESPLKLLPGEEELIRIIRRMAGVD